MRSANLLRLSGLIGTLFFFNDLSKDKTLVKVWTSLVIYNLTISKKVDSDDTHIW